MLSDLRQYLGEVRRSRSVWPREIAIYDLLRWYHPWMRSHSAGRQALTDGLPWVTFPATEFLQRILTSKSEVFEWGSGGSSVFFAGCCARVVSVEHDAGWNSRVESRIAGLGYSNWTGRLVLPTKRPDQLAGDPTDWDGYVSSDTAYSGSDFRRYVEVIDEFEDQSFDVILIDGRARPSCFKHALTKVRIGGYIMWDNSERDSYFNAMDKAPETFRRTDFPGPIRYLKYFLRTTVWERLA